MFSLLPACTVPVKNFVKKTRSIFLPVLRKTCFPALFLLGFLPGKIAHAQVEGYIFNTTTGNSLETGSFTNLLGTGLDDDVSATTNIGFTFQYGGTNYTTFSATSNGILRLGGAATSDFDNVIANLADAYLLPYWDDNFTDIDGNVQFLVKGVPGSQKLVVEYNLSNLSNPGTADKHFQIWLFESTNTVMFVYGSGNNLNDAFSTAILTNGSSDFISINTSTHNSSTTVAQNNNSVWPGAGRAYSFISSGTLPVSFVNFSGYKDGNSNQLQWSTATEINNLGFEVQRSSDGINYSTVGFINSLAAGGNSNSLLQYRFTDNNVTGSKQHYRLRQVDNDNRSKLSNIVLIDGSKAVILNVDALFPNPASTTVNVQIASPGREKLILSVRDLAGKIVIQKAIQVEQGNNIISLDISQLSNNTYLLQLTDKSGTGNTTSKLMVIK